MGVEFVHLILVIALYVLPRRLLDTLFVALQLAAANHNNLHRHGGREGQLSSHYLRFPQFVPAFVDAGEGVCRAVLVTGHLHLEGTLFVGHDGVVVALYPYYDALQALGRRIGTRHRAHYARLRLGH